MLADVVGLLRCPHCSDPLRLNDRAVTCANGHSFDVARHGYVSLLPGDARTGTADTADMARAREAFLSAGHYAPLARLLAGECERAVSGVTGAIVEVGAGTGYHLARALDGPAGRPGLALDLSKHAARRAARAHSRIGAVVCDAWRSLPVQTACAAAVLSVFSPRSAAELRRILRPDGVLLLVTPTPRHLRELVRALGLLTVDPCKEERLGEQLGPLFDLRSKSSLEIAMELGHEDIERLVGMGPSAHHTDPVATRRQVAILPDPSTVTASFTVSVYRPR